MGRRKKIKFCNHCKCDKENIAYYNDPSGSEGTGRVCRNCWMTWRRNGSFDKKRSTKGLGYCKCGRVIYRVSKWGMICTGCRKGHHTIKNGNGVSVKNPNMMGYDERETCRRLVVKWKRGMLNAADIYSMVNIYIDYHFKNEEMDTLKMDRQIDKMMTWMAKLFEKSDI